MNHEPYHAVLTIRDYFAVRCLAALINADTGSSSLSTQKAQSHQAYSYADAMMEERGR